MSFKKGYHAELELVDFLTQRGFYALRVPISGGRGFPCDVLAAKNVDKRAYEVKSTSKNVLYLYKRDVEPFIEFCQNFNFDAYLAVRWKYKKKNPWTFKRIEEAKNLKIFRK